MDIPWEFRCLFWWKNLVKKKPEPPLIKINNNENGINSILFLLPNKKEYAQIINYLIKPEKELPEHTIHYVCHKEALPYYPLGLHKNFITFGDDNLNQMGIINNEPFLDRVRTLNNDALIDLNITFNPATTMLVWESKKPLKIISWDFMHRPQMIFLAIFGTTGHSNLENPGFPAPGEKS